MTREQALQSILTGVRIVEEQKKAGVELLATGEMGIGNTTTSSAVLAALLQIDPEKVTGRGAGLTSAGLSRKIQVIRQALAVAGRERSGGCTRKGALISAAWQACIWERQRCVFGADRRIYLRDGGASCLQALSGGKGIYDRLSQTQEAEMQILLEALGLSASLDCDMCLEGTGSWPFSGA